MRKPKITFLDFCLELRGYDYFDKRIGNQVFKYELFYMNYTPNQIRNTFNVKEKIIRYI
jgi:hypothetical protein